MNQELGKKIDETQTTVEQLRDRLTMVEGQLQQANTLLGRIYWIELNDYAQYSAWCSWNGRTQA